MKKRILVLFSITILAVFFNANCDTYTKEEVDKKTNDLLLVSLLPHTSGETVAWGYISFDGTIRGGSGNYTCTYAATGSYTIRWTGSLRTLNRETVVIAQIQSLFTPSLIVYFPADDGSYIEFRTYNNTGAATTSSFSFAVIK
ncbi:MAG: hypothetical protein KA369_17830 [Spirochaetes bacterium]|jgi:hypothetical protein|nr:hypothetical protein [Spirochaetota bacterium]